jgi:hypothetical protein
MAVTSDLYDLEQTDIPYVARCVKIYDMVRYVYIWGPCNLIYFVSSF